MAHLKTCRLRRASLIGVVLAVLAATPASGADLMQLYRMAQASDPAFDAARHTRDAAREKSPQARAGLLPSVAINGSDTRSRGRTVFVEPPAMNRDVRAWTWTLQLTQPLVRLSNIYAYAEAESIVEQAEAQYAQAEQDLILTVAQAYFGVLVAKESIDAADAQVKAMTGQLGQAKRGYEKGITAITDLHEAKSRLDQARSQRVAAANELEVARSELERRVGEVPERLAALGTGVVPRPQPDDPKAWIAQARENNPAVRGQEAAYRAADANVSRNRAEHAPSVDLVASYGSNYSSGSMTTPSDYSTQARVRTAGVQLTVPIFSGGATNSRVAEAVANRFKAQAQLEEARRKAAADARQAFVAIANGLSQVEALESAVESGVSAVTGNRVGYKLGIRINTDVLGAEQQLYASRRDLAKARYEVLLQGFKLKAAAGTLSEADLAAINGLLVER